MFVAPLPFDAKVLNTGPHQEFKHLRNSTGNVPIVLVPSTGSEDCSAFRLHENNADANEAFGFLYKLSVELDHGTVKMRLYFGGALGIGSTGT
jgi:hypothetical protein